MPSTLVPFTEEHLEPAVALFLTTYKHEQAQSPLLPSLVFEDPARIRQALRACLANPGVALLQQQQLVGYMLTGSQFPWKGQRAVLVPEYGHSAIAAEKQALYQQMYQALAQEWANHHLHLHLLGHFAHDQILNDTLYHLGFGAILAERLRDVSTVVGAPEVPIVEEKEVRNLLALEVEHHQYYLQSPMFIRKPTDAPAMLAALETQAQQGVVFLVVHDHDEPCAYVSVGESARAGEGFLLQETNTAQIKSAYARPGSRGKGLGTALLHAAVQWAQRQGYDRLFVEHETANVTGARFWGKHFSPYVYFSMRYIDTSV